MEPTDDDILVLDVETTGTDPATDQIIELAIQAGLSDDRASRVWRVKPAVPIPPDAQAIHGISMDDLADCRPFSDHATEIRRMVATAAVLVGYNLSFDLGMLQAEFARAGQQPLDLTAKLLIDPLRLWKRCEPRSLDDAHRRFVGEAFGDAHSAAGDTAATAHVLVGMLAAFDLQGRSWADLATLCEPDRHLWIGPSRHLQWRDGAPTVMFGRHAGSPLHRLARDYLEWMLARDFPPHVQEICLRALHGDADALRAWIIERHGAPKAARLGMTKPPSPPGLGGGDRSRTNPRLR